MACVPNVSTNSAISTVYTSELEGLWRAARRSFFVNSGVFIPGWFIPTGLVAKNEKKSRSFFPCRES